MSDVEPIDEGADLPREPLHGVEPVELVEVPVEQADEADMPAPHAPEGDDAVPVDDDDEG